MSLSLRRFFALPVFAASLVTLNAPTFAAIKPTAISNKVPGGGGRSAGYFEDGKDGDQVRIGVALYKGNARAFSQSAKGEMIDLVDVAMGEKYAAGQPITIYLREAKSGYLLTLVDAESPVTYAFNIDWTTGKLTRAKSPRVKGTGKALLAALGKPQGEIALLPGGTNLWEIER